MSLKRKQALRCITMSTLLCALWSCNKNVEMKTEDIIRPVKLMEINLSNQKVFTFPGEVKSSEQAQLAFRVPGEILSYSVSAGTRVTKGQILVSLEPSEYELYLKSQQANYNLVNVQYQRSAVLIKDFLISQQDFDNIETELKVSQSLLNRAQEDLSHTTIKAPYDGIIAATYNQPFEYVPAQQPVMSLQSLNSIDVNISVPEGLITPFKNAIENAEQEQFWVRFSVDLSQAFPMSFKELSSVADAETGSYNATFILPKPTELNLFSGMTAEVSIPLVLNAQNVTSKLPPLAVIKEDDKFYVWKYLANSQTIDKVAVQFDADNRLISGLNEGDQIVAAGAKELRQGQKVKPWTKERGL